MFASMLEIMRCWDEMFARMASSPRKGDALLPFWMFALGEGEFQPEELGELAREIGPEASEAYVTAAEILHERGKADGKAGLVLHLIRLKFGVVPGVVERQVMGSTVADLDVWAERVLNASRLEELPALNPR
jgi:hypothetical protein